MFRAKAKAPYEDAEMQKIFLDPTARVSLDKKTAGRTYGAQSIPKSPAHKAKAEQTRTVVESLAKAGAAGANSKVGVDVESIDAVPVENETFIERNFTQEEQDFCRKAADAKASFAGRWSAKEAVFKSMGVESKGAGAGMKDIEILSDEKGAPIVKVCLPLE